MVTSLRRAVEDWAGGGSHMVGPLALVEEIHGHHRPASAAAPDPDLRTLALPDTDHDGLVEAVVGVEVQVRSERLSRLRWRRPGRDAAWELVDVQADGRWRSEAWCLHPRTAPSPAVAGVALTPLGLSTVAAPGWLVAAEVAATEPRRLRWRADAAVDLWSEADVEPGVPLLVVQRGPAGTTARVAVEVQTDTGWAPAGLTLTMPHGHPREGWCEIPDPLPAPRPSA